MIGQTADDATASHNTHPRRQLLVQKRGEMRLLINWGGRYAVGR
jgi:hypothetical protein